MDLIRHPGLPVIKASVVGVEKLREELGLSKKQLSDMLQVDPASLSRWSKDSEKIPSYIWNSMFLIKNQYVTVNDNQPTKARKGEDSNLEVIAMVDHLQKECVRLKNELTQREQISLGWKSLLLINTLIIFYYFINSWF